MDVCKSLKCISNADLSPITKKTYLERLRYLLQNTKADLYEILTHPDKYLDWIKNHSSSLQTQKSYISSILAVFKHTTPSLKEKERVHYYAWYTEFKKIHDEIDNRYKQNEPSLKQRKAYVAFPEIVEKRETLKKGSKEKLLLALYTYIPPLRSDYNKVYIYHSVKEKYEHDNYVLLTENPLLVLNEFKTKKNKEKFEKPIPKELVDELKASLEKHPREWIFVDRSGEPYNSGSFTKWANRTFKTLFDKPLTISLIRHSFINNLDFNRLTVQQKEDLSSSMAHSPGTQDRYRLIFN
jgi:integrase